MTKEINIDLELEEVKRYIQVDYDDDDKDIEEYIELSLIYIDEMVGEAYKENINAVKLSKLLRKKLILDMYDNKSTTISNKMKVDKVTISILDKLSTY